MAIKTMIRSRERVSVKFTFCFCVSAVICLTVTVFLYKHLDSRFFMSEFPLLMMLCVGVSWAAAVGSPLKSGILTLFLIGEYGGLSLFSKYVTGDWEMRIFGRMVLQVSLKEIGVPFFAAALTAAAAYGICAGIVSILARRVKKGPEILPAVSCVDMMPRLPGPHRPEFTVSREEIYFLLGMNEQISLKNDAH